MKKRVWMIGIILIILIVIVIGGIYYKYVYPYSGNAPEITQEELECGTYYGQYNQKKPGTPDNWVHDGEGTMSATWHAPSNTNSPMDCNEEPPLIGGCAGVSLENLQECCENWASENDIIHIQCLGGWEIKDNQCSWKCETTEEEEFCGMNAASSCEDNNDCRTGGCCGELCHDTSLSPSMCVDCNWKDCYNASKYNLSCKCVEGQCIWN